MKRKRFIKLLRAKGFSERIINAFCFAVKYSSGRIDYATLYAIIPQYNEKNWDYWETFINHSLKRKPFYRINESED